ncbi:hypothetical protein FIBSPDRAFT_217837 [Athelia psychrophila]|uniref:Uncharacterized protein n=1 Tax=Athelia psychrophila TaxID=1759441 RepID=A0A165ZAR3_9AGAM|nr:hypothetical protein FIBSPDRAFT_217837 [Fibularhizoctonia sp. CBS 109695]
MQPQLLCESNVIGTLAFLAWCCGSTFDMVWLMVHDSCHSTSYPRRIASSAHSLLSTCPTCPLSLPSPPGPRSPSSMLPHP